MTFEEWWAWRTDTALLRGTDPDKESGLIREAWEAAYDNGCQDTLDEVFGHKEEIEDDQ